jgi:putative transcriptional regulator
MNQRPLPSPHIPDDLDVAAIRRKMRYGRTGYALTQENFARAIGVPAGTVRQWEQKRRQPTGAGSIGQERKFRLPL